MRYVQIIDGYLSSFVHCPGGLVLLIVMFISYVKTHSTTESCGMWLSSINMLVLPQTLYNGHICTTWLHGQMMSNDLLRMIISNCDNRLTGVVCCDE